jgi:DNA-binding transcriptional ArsR family regulator
MAKVFESQVSKSDEDRVFETAGELFALLSTPVRLKILSALCNSERNVTDLVSATSTKQSNLSQHLNALYRAGILGKRREGTQIFYSVLSQRAVQLCRAVCTQVAMDLDSESESAAEDRLFPAKLRR